MQFVPPIAAIESDLRIQAARTRVVSVPLRFALGTSADIVRSVPMVLVDVTTVQGVAGRAYAFGYTAAGANAIAKLVEEAVERVEGHPAAPLSVSELLSQRYRLLGVTGALRMALSIVDVALWDAQAIAKDLPLHALLGAEPRKIPAYDSRGLGLMPPAQLADEALSLAEDKKLSAVKLRRAMTESW